MEPPEILSSRASGSLLTLGVLLVLVCGVGGVFAADFGSTAPEPAEFDETVSLGLTYGDELRLDDANGVELPRVQVFYSQYPYVVGYYGVETFLTDRRAPTHRQQFGFPTTVYVTDYADREVSLTDGGLPRTDEPPGWTEAAASFYVVDSAARTPSGPTILPFGTRDAAASFADEHGGRVLPWEAVLEVDVESNDAAAVRNRTERQRRGADRTVASRRGLRDRPVGAVVGENGTTVQDAVDAAAPNTTVVVPAGTHEGPVEIDRPVTLRGTGNARIEGDGNGTVINVTAPRTAVVGLNISGTGSETPGPTVTDDMSHHTTGPSYAESDTVGEASWDSAVEEDYAQGDVAIDVRSAPEALVSAVEIHTDAAGIFLYDSPGSVVRNTTVVGSDDYRNGHMGLVAMRSPAVVEHSTFVGGLDGVYTHRADGIVVRNNEMRDNRMGIHLMFTSDALLADNTVRDEEMTGIHVMTGPRGNSLVGNDIAETETAISFGGSDSYVANNTLTDSDLGLRIEADASIVEGNVIADNRDGVETWTLLPTNRVTRNDFVGNERHVAVSSGRLRVWTHEGEGNYWEGAVGSTDGTVIQRPYTPTDPVDGRLHRVAGAETLALAPALDALAGFQGAITGMRANEVIDTAPRCRPVNEAWFERTGRTDTEPMCAAPDRTAEADR